MFPPTACGARFLRRFGPLRNSFPAGRRSERVPRAGARNSPTIPPSLTVVRGSGCCVVTRPWVALGIRSGSGVGPGLPRGRVPA